MPLRISWSGLKTHEECKQKGYLTRTGKKASLDDQRNFFPGNVTDRTVRNWLKNDPEHNPGIMPDMVSATIDRELARIQAGDPDKKVDPGVMKWRDADDRERVRKECIEAVTKIEPLLQKYVVPYEHWADFRFSAPLELPHPQGGFEEILAIGFMDILVKDDKGRYFVHDVKHTRDNSYWRKTIAQLAFYDFAVELIYGQPMALGSLMQPLCTKIMVPYKPSADSRTQLQTRVAKMARDIWLDDRTPKEGTAGCNWCPTKNACERYKPVAQPGGGRRIKI